ncbi:hypothetical protein [Streptomyces sp. SM12]|nr:hypothetical protein [Streptomyces sp. SM12]
MSARHRRRRRPENGWLWPAVAYTGCGTVLATLLLVVGAWICAGLR